MTKLRDKRLRSESDSNAVQESDGSQPEVGGEVGVSQLAPRRLEPGDPLLGHPCPSCRRPCQVGDLIQVLCDQPANAVEDAKFRHGLPYISGPPVELHYNCGDPQGTEEPTGGVR